MSPSAGEVTLAGLRTVAVGDPAAEHIVVLVHGFQMIPEDLAPFAQSLRVSAWFLFPEGPLWCAPGAGGAFGETPARSRAWWHIDPAARAASMAVGPRDFADEHPPGLPIARACFGAFLDEVMALSGSRPVVVGGFSQGGMVVTDTQLRTPRRLAGMVLLSSSRIALDEWATLPDRRALQGIPTLITHGTDDRDLAFAAGEGLRDFYTSAGAEVTWCPFLGGHEIPLVAWRALKRFLNKTHQSIRAVGAPEAYDLERTIGVHEADGLEPGRGRPE